MNTKCACGCGFSPIYKGAKYVHGHHLKLPQFRNKPKPVPARICKFCKNSFVPKSSKYKIQPFCSRKCGFEGRKKGIILNCFFCNNTFYCPQNKTKGRNKRRFCSKICRLKFWDNKSKKDQKANCYRRNAWKHYQKRCYDCGYNKNPKILIIHHIDENRLNGKIENLIPVCPNCHTIRHL